jgi:formylglycine-generating enzyme required for sulfatase activity
VSYSAFTEKRKPAATPASQTTVTAPQLEQEPALTCALGIRFAQIQAGTFMMGSPATEKDREASDELQHRITLTNPFYLGIHPVTQAQWREIMGRMPSQFKGDTLPVEKVSWHDCIEFCKRLSIKDGRQYRLPTEAEWEAACRAGTTTPFYFGETISTEQANFDGTSAYGGGKSGMNRRQTTPIGQFPPNAWGLYDMHGNVWEWCLDWYAVYPPGELTDYQGPEKGKMRVIRGGSWNHPPKRCRSAYRHSIEPQLRWANVGLRICFSVD